MADELNFEDDADAGFSAGAGEDTGIADDPKDTDPQDTEPKDTDPKPDDPQDGKPKADDPKDTEPKDTGPKPDDPQDGKPKDTDPQDTEPKDTDPKDEEPKGGDPELNDLSDADYYERVLKPGIPDAELPLPGGGTMNLNNFMEEWPEIGTAVVFLADHIANAVLGGAIDSGEIASGEVFKEIASNYENEKLNKKIVEKHSDGIETLKSAEFASWLENAPPFMQKAMESGSVEDKVYLLDQYKGVKASSAAAPAKAKQAKTKKRVDALHGGSLSSQPGARASSSDPDDAKAEDEGFNAAIS